MILFYFQKLLNRRLQQPLPQQQQQQHLQQLAQLKIKIFLRCITRARRTLITSAQTRQNLMTLRTTTITTMTLMRIHATIVRLSHNELLLESIAKMITVRIII